MRRGDNAQVSLHKLGTTNLEALFDNFGSKLVDAVAVSIGKNVVNDTALVRWRRMLSQVLDAPIAKLTVSDKVDAGNDFLYGGALEKSVL